MKTLRALNPAQPTAEFRPLSHIVDQAVSPRRFFVLLVSGFAFLGLVLAALGIYGVISYLVSQQTQEIGIRIGTGSQCLPCSSVKMQSMTCHLMLTIILLILISRNG